MYKGYNYSHNCLSALMSFGTGGVSLFLVPALQVTIAFRL